MRILIVKTSSLGDVIHTLPALTDAGKNISSLTIDWVVEENFAEIPAWHPLVNHVIPVAIRRWRKNIFSVKTWSQFYQFRRLLREKQYDLIIDAQGLLKSAMVTRMARGVCCGLDRKSARGSWAACFYQKTFFVDQQQHAVTRMRQLFSQALGYVLPNTVPDYGVDRNIFSPHQPSAKYLVFLHGTTWPTKHWPEAYWVALATLANQANFSVKLPWGNLLEQERAQRIAAQCPQVEVLPKLDLTSMATVLANATAIAAVDTGLGHLAAALDVPTVSIYGPTNPLLTGAMGQSQQHLAAQFPCAPCLNRECTHFAYTSKQLSYPPCFTSISPESVWAMLKTFIK